MDHWAQGSNVLKPYDGHIENDTIWYIRMRDHLVNVNPDYIRVLDLTEATKETITNAILCNVVIPNLVVDWEWLKQHLWTAMPYFVTDLVLGRRKVYTPGQEWAGLELWRALFTEGKGVAIKVNASGQTSFHTFPKCSCTENPQLHLGE